MAVAATPPKQKKYGLLWEPLMDPVAIEMVMIRAGGTYKGRGEGLFFHFQQFQKLVWPDYLWHKWNTLQLQCYLDYRIIGTMGPASSGKTTSAAINALTDFYCWPDCTTVLVTSTEREMLKMRVWGELVAFHRRAKSRFSFLPGNMIESALRIVNESKWEANDGRDFRNGICGVPCKKGGSYQGLGSFSGIKNKRVILIADECMLMPRIFVDSISNLNKNQFFKCVALGNPKETTDALGIVCEPSAEIGGWDGSIDQTPKTKTWPTRFDKGICVQLVGSDCPNMDVPEDAPVPYPFLITREAIAADVKFFGTDSWHFAMMNEGRMPRGQGLRRVITRQQCLKFGAMEEPVWKNDKITKIGGLDASYSVVGEGDRTVFVELHFGEEVNGTQILALIETIIVPIRADDSELPEDQTVIFLKNLCEQKGIDPHNVFFDSTGRGTLMSAFARLWSPHVVPVEFGGKPSERVVSSHIRVTAREYFQKRVSELWFGVAHTVQSGQFRGMTEEVMMEGCAREWGYVTSNRIEVEPKDLTKKKTGRSPDLFDALAVGVEGAIQKGFIIKSKTAPAAMIRDDKWKQKYTDRISRLEANHRLNYST